jgi:hypothetical protein
MMITFVQNNVPTVKATGFVINVCGLHFCSGDVTSFITI